MLISACVKKVTKRKGHRMYDKTLACYFCEKLLKHRIQKHIENVHGNEMMVAEAVAKTSKTERENKMKKIKNLGAFKYNIKVIKAGHGNVIVARRPTKKTLEAKHFLPCIHCYGFFYKKELWRHSRKCPHNMRKGEKQTEVISRSKHLLAGGISTYASCDAQIPKELQETVFQKMRTDKVHDTIIKDSLIIHFGKVLINQLGPRRTGYVSQRMRQLGKLKIKLNEMSSENHSLDSYIAPQHFDLVISAVKEMAGFRRNEQRISVFDTPSLALTLGHNLVKVAELKRGIAIRSTDDVAKNESVNFLQLHASDWTHLISSIALATLKTNKFNKPAALPVTSDLLILKNYLDEQMVSLTQQLSENANSTVWKSLAEATMTRITLFNKRRSNEVAKMLRTSYQKRTRWTTNMNEEILGSLKPVEKVLLKR